MNAKRTPTPVGIAFLLLAAFCGVVNGEDYVDVPHNVDSVYEFTPFYRHFFTSGQVVYQYSYTTQRVRGSLPINHAVVGEWSTSAIEGPELPEVTAYGFPNATRYGFDCSHPWIHTNGRLYHYTDGFYIRMRHDGSHSGGDTIRNGWWGVPDRIDACVELSVEAVIHFVGDYLLTYCSKTDHLCYGSNTAVIQEVMPGVPSAPSAVFKHPYLGNPIDVEDGYAGQGFTDGVEQQPEINQWLTIFKGDQVWMWSGRIGLNVGLSYTYPTPITGFIVPGYPQNLTQFGTCSGIRYHAAPIAEIHDSSVSVDGLTDYAYGAGLDCRWIIQRPSWQERQDFNGFSVQFRVFDLRAGSGDYLELWNTSANATVGGESNLLFKWTAVNAPSTAAPLVFDSSVQRLTLHFATDVSTLWPSANGWQLTYTLANRRSDSASGAIRWTALYEKLHAVIPSLNPPGGSRTVKMFIQPRTPVAVHSQFSFELVSFPAAYQSPGDSNIFRTVAAPASCYVEVFEGIAGENGVVTPRLVRNCSGTDLTVVTENCHGSFVGNATVYFHSLLPAGDPARFTSLIGRSEVLGTCGGVQSSSAYAATIVDGSGLYFYMPQMTCEWVLTYPDEPMTEQFAIAFQNIRGSTESMSDTLSIYDGNTTFAPLIASYESVFDTGMKAIFTTSPFARVVFFSDNSHTGPGFSLDYVRLFKPNDSSSSIVGFRSAFVTPSNGGALSTEAGRRQTVHITMRDYMSRNISANWGAIQWYVRFISHATYWNATVRRMIAESAIPVHTIAGDPYSLVIESTTAVTDTKLEYTTPSVVGPYDAVLVAVMNVQVPAAPRIVAFYDQSPFVLAIAAKTAFGPASVLSADTASFDTPTNSTLAVAAGETMRLYLSIHDSFGNPAAADPDSDLLVFAKSNLMFAPVMITAVQGTTHTFEISAVIETAGLYTITAFVLGLPARGSPALVRINPADIAPPQVSLSAAALSLRVVSTDLRRAVRYELQARDRFGNAVVHTEEGGGGGHGNATAFHELASHALPVEVLPVMIRGALKDVLVQLPTAPYDHRNGTYAFTVSATAKLQAALHVYVNHTEIAGSPFTYTAGDTILTTEYAQPGGWLPAFLAVASFMVALSIVALIGLWRMWAHPVMRAASPAFLVAILVASIVAYASVPVFIVYPPTAASCMLSAGMGHAAYCALWLILCVKLWRIAKIIAAVRSVDGATPKYSDAVLFRYVCLGIVIVLLYLLAWFLAHPPQPTRIETTIEDSETGRTLLFVGCVGGGFWGPVLYVAEGCLLLYGVILSIQLRGVSSAFAESRWVGAATYNVLVVGGAAIALITSGVVVNPAVTILLEAIGILYVTAVTVCFLFVPKFLYIIDPRRFVVHVAAGGAVDDVALSHMPRGASTAFDPAAGQTAIPAPVMAAEGSNLPPGSNGVGGIILGRPYVPPGTVASVDSPAQPPPSLLPGAGAVVGTAGGGGGGGGGGGLRQKDITNWGWEMVGPTAPPPILVSMPGSGAKSAAGAGGDMEGQPNSGGPQTLTAAPGAGSDGSATPTTTGTATTASARTATGTNTTKATLASNGSSLGSTPPQGPGTAHNSVMDTTSPAPPPSSRRVVSVGSARGSASPRTVDPAVAYTAAAAAAAAGAANVTVVLPGAINSNNSNNSRS